MIVSATELANDSKSILDTVVKGREVAQIQRHGATMAEIHPAGGVSRDELLRLLRGRGFTETESRELKKSMEAAAEVFGHTGSN
jgi:antitoxin (DNA-binding transcriptional repressor) of toxin-antitoxin stability system